MLLLSALALADAFPGASDECESVMSTLLNIGALSGMRLGQAPTKSEQQLYTKHL